MSSQFAARSVRLGQLFADPLTIEAAAYQRSYAWTAQEAGRLLDDVISAHDADGDGGENADYFLGTMLFIDPDRAALYGDGWPLAGPPRAFEVVDGLQRLTTLTILFCVLRDLDEDEGETPHAGLIAAIRTVAGNRSRLTLRNADEVFFQAHVRAAGASHKMPDSDKLSPAETRIMEVREHFLGALMDVEAAQRRRLADFLLERCSVVMVATIGIDRAHRMFMVLNDTGKPLARNDILKAELLGSVPARASASAGALWNEAETLLGEQFEALFSHIRAMYGRPGSHVIAGVRAVATEAGGAETFIKSVLAPAAAVLDDLRHRRHEGSAQSADITRRLDYLLRLPASDWVPPAMLWRLGKGKDPAELAWFLQALERLAYGMRILGLGSNRRVQRFGAVVTAIRNGADLKAATSPLNLSREDLRNIDYNLKDLHARSAPTCRLLLLRLNDEIAGNRQSLPFDELTVEHVLPRKLGSTSLWRMAFADPQEREQCTQSLGNLLLVTRAQNDKAANLDFGRKHAIYFGTPGTAVPALNEFVRGKKDWTPALVREREADLLRRLQTLWGFGGGESRREAAEAGPRRGRRTKAA